MPLFKGLCGFMWDSLGPISNGGGGIRTHGALADTLVFKTRALNHSTTPPRCRHIRLAKVLYQKAYTT